MAIKPPAPLIRTNYIDPTQGNYQTNGNPDSSGFDPSTVLPRSGVTSHGENKVDMEQYFRPLERLHASGAHGAGVAWGLKASSTLGQQGVTVAPGVALDAAGKHAYLAQGGQAEIGPTADNPNVNPDLVAVSSTGSVLPTAGFTGDYFVTIQWWETFDSATYISSGGVVCQFNDTPWLRLLKAADYNPDAQVILAKVSLDVSGNVTALTYGDPGGLQRYSVSLPAQTLRLHRATNLAGPSVDSPAWGEVRAREGGGIQLAVSHGADLVEVLRDDGKSQGNFNKMAIAAEYIAARQANGAESVVIDTESAVLKVGTTGNEGDVIVTDAAGNLAVTLDGSPAQVVVGGPNNNGAVRIKDAERRDSIRLDGKTGDMLFRGVLRDDLGGFLMNHLQMRELVGGQHTALHTHFFGSLGFWGDTGTFMSIIGAEVAAGSGGGGNVTLNFSDLSFTGSNGDYQWGTAHGLARVFTATPQAIGSRTDFDVGTSDAWADLWYEVYSDHMDIHWNFNPGSGGHQLFRFLIVGPTSTN